MYLTDFVGINFIPVREAYAQNVVYPAQAGGLVSVSAPASFASFKAISIDSSDPFKINFMIDTGNKSGVDGKEPRILVEYFLTFLTVPEEDVWVNLSPSEPDRIVNIVLGETLAGKDMLMADYLLKQLAASMTFPDQEPGRRFWDEVYAKIRRKYGDVDLPLNTFSKVWVVPRKAVVYEKEGAAFIASSSLQVMIDEDYTSMKKSFPSQEDLADRNAVDALYTTIAREIIVPALEREVNEGEHFASLRQMFDSLILAIWFKRKLKDHVINQIYTDQKKISGIEIEDRDISRKVYEKYMLALREGVYNIIREEYDPSQKESIPRRYFSGGFSFRDSAQRVEFRPLPLEQSRLEWLMDNSFGRNLYRLTLSLMPRGMSRKTLAGLLLSAGLMLSPVPGEAAPAASFANSSAHAVQVSSRVIRLKGRIPVQDRALFKKMKEDLTIDDVMKVYGKPYRFNANNMRKYLNKKVGERMGWRDAVLLRAFQSKHGIKTDGIFGSSVRGLLMSRVTVAQAAAEGVARAVAGPLPVPVAEKSFPVKR